MRFTSPSLAIVRAGVPLLFLLFFWQTRLVVNERYALYDYSIWFVYLIDILFLILLIGTYRLWRGPLTQSGKISGLVWAGGIVVIWVMGVLVSVSWQAFAYRLLRLILGGVFALWISWLIKSRNYPESRLVEVLTLGFLPLSVLGLVEVVIGRSLNLQWIGEWEFSASMPGIATIQVSEFLLLRPYATFPHPNVFAAVAGVLGIYWLLKPFKVRFEKVILGALIFALLLSFSRTAWLGYVVVALNFRGKEYWLKIRSAEIFRRVRGTAVAVLVVSLLVILRFGQLFTEDSLSFARRAELNLTAFRVWQDYPLLGVGLNQFIYRLGEYWLLFSGTQIYQPVHNVFLLILAETGALGFVVSISFVLKAIIKTWGSIPDYLKGWWVFIAITGMLDHYWLTLPVTYYLFCLTLGLTLARMNVRNEKS